MAATGTSSVGIEFYRSTATITGSFAAWGTCLAIDLPASMNEVMEMTPLNSTTQAFIKERLLRMEAFDVTMVMDNNCLETARDDQDATTPRFYQIIYPSGVSKNNWEFAGHVTKIAPPKVSENSPTKMVFKVTIQPEGVLNGLT